MNFVPSVGGYYLSAATNTAQKGSWGGATVRGRLLNEGGI